MTIEQKLEEMKRLVDAASIGPWTCREELGDPRWADANFIAASRTFIPAAIELIERYREALINAKFDLEMTRDTGGFNHRAIHKIEEAIAFKPFSEEEK